MIDLEKPKTEAVRILAGKTMSEPRSGCDFEIVENNDRADRRLIHGEKKSMLALRWIGRAVDQDKLRLL